MLSAQVAAYQAKMAQATAATSKFGATAMASASKNSAAFRTVGFAAVAFAGVLAFAMKGAADAAISFESTFAGVRKTVDATEPEFEAMAQGIRDMAKTIPVSVEELNKIAESAGQLGVAKGDILSFTRTVADLGASTTLASDDAANALARIANIMGTASGDFSRLGSTIVALGNAGASTEPEIVDFALRIAGAGKIAGLTESDILGLSNAFLSVGIPAEAGGTAVQKALLGITSAVTTGGAKLNEFADTAGMSAEAFAAAWRADPVDAFLSFIEGLGAQGQQGILTLQDLFGVNERVARSFLSVAAGGDKARISVELGSTAWEENNALTEEASKRYATTASQIQIAGNRMHDAAISFGEVMLPALAAVAAQIGNIADAFGSLPGPVRTAVVVFGAVVTVMLLLAGGSLLVQSSLLKLRVAMAAAGVQGGLFAGSLKMAASAINPVTIALTMATIGLSVYANEKARAKQVTDDFTAAIKADTNELGANTKALLIHDLSAADLLATFKEMGTNIAEVTDLILASADGDKEATAALKELLGEMSGEPAVKFLGILKGLQGGMKDAALETEAAGDATKDAGDKADDAGPKFNELGQKVDDAGNVMEEAASKADKLTAALEALAGTAITVEETSLAWLDSLAALRDELGHGTKTLDDNTQAGRDNRKAILDSVHAAFDHGAAVAEETGSLKKGVAATQDHIRELIKEAEKAGISKDEIHDYIRELNLTPKQISTIISLRGADTVVTQIGTIITQLKNLPASATISIGLEGGPPAGVGHAGGVVGSLHARRMHAGGRVRGDEQVVIAQRGEHLMTARRYAELTSMKGSGGAAARIVVNCNCNPDIVVRADRRRWTDELDHDFTYAGRWS